MIDAYRQFEIENREFNLDELEDYNYQKSGRWLSWIASNGITTGSKCSECGYTTKVQPLYAKSFCPNCGAKMIREDIDK